MCAGFVAELPLVPSPKSHANDTMLSPASGSCEALPSKSHTAPLHDGGGPAVGPMIENEAIGAALAAVTFFATGAEARPWLSTTVSATVNVPVVAYVCDGLTPTPLVPSPKLQL